MGRDPSPSGLAHYERRLEQGFPREYIFAEIVHSAEFNNICRAAGIDRGTHNPPQDVMVQVFTLRLFWATLERPPTPEGLEFFVNDLSDGVRTGARVAYDFIFSDEMEARDLSDEDFIIVLCRAMMGRYPSEGGKQFWVNRMNTEYNGNRQNIFAEFVISDEFSQICDDFGIERGYAP